MKIAMFGHKYVPSRQGGIEQVVSQLGCRMAELGHTVICYNRSGRRNRPVENRIGNIPGGIRLRTVWTLDVKGFAALTSAFSAALCCCFSGADVVHIHGEGPALWCWIPKLAGKRVVVTVHGLDWQREKWRGSPAEAVIRMGEKTAAAFADTLIVLSKNTQTYFRETHGRETLWIPNGVTRPSILPAQEITAEYGLQKDGYFLFLGRLVPEKGIHRLLVAFRGVNTAKRLVIAGASSDSDDYVRTLHAMGGEDERVLFTGFVQGRTLQELYSNAYGYILPSDLEGMPLSLLEAMSYGNCCVVSDIPECTEVTGPWGIVVPRSDTAALTGVLQRLCDHPDEVERYRSHARQYICSRFSWEETTKRTLEAYQ